MVQVYAPHSFRGSKVANTPYLPQQSLLAGGGGDIIPQEVFEQYNEGWALLDWENRIPVEVNVGQVPSTQTEFPLTIHGIFPGLVNAAKKDLRFVEKSTGTEMKYEVPFFNPANGAIFAKSKIQSLSNLTKFDIYRDNPAAVDNQNPNAVYTPKNEGVFHMDQTTFGAGSTIDSTSNGNNGTPSSFPDPQVTSIPGKFEGKKALQFATSTIINMGDELMENMAGEGTIYHWINTDNFPAPAGTFPIINSLRNGGDNWEIFQENTVPEVTMRYGDGTNNVRVNMAGLLTPGTWHLLARSWKRPTGRLRMWIDGVLELNTTIAPWTLGSTTGADTFLGNSVLLQATRSYLGGYDETVFSNIEESDDFMKTIFNNQSNFTTFATVGATENREDFVGGISYDEGAGGDSGLILVQENSV